MASGARRINPIHIESFKAGEALAAHRIVIWHSTTADTVIYPTATPDTQMVGVTLTSAASGELVDVVMLGPALLTVDGNAAAIVAGDWLEGHSTTGYGGKRALSDGATYRELIGRALEASSADNDEIAVFVDVTVTQTA